MEADKRLSVDELIKAIDNSIEHFDKTNKCHTLNSNLCNIKITIEKCAASVDEIRKFAHEYDFDEDTSGNGYHSFVDIFDSAIRKTKQICKRLIKNREKILFRADNYARYNVQSLPEWFHELFIFCSQIHEWHQIFDALSHICLALIEVHHFNDDRNLFTECNVYDSILTRTLSIVDPKPFYGSNIGFQFCSSMRPIIKFVVLTMASYYSFYYKSKPKVFKVLRFPISFSKYHLYPRKRATKYLHASQNSTTEFCRVRKSFLLNTKEHVEDKIIINPEVENDLMLMKVNLNLSRVF